ncbi:hypothetical protein QN397_15600 [Variovorax sp. RTB1]|uniref:hypothetical protein n=1 Tax=Variovorax sp. RTB1 TaxID=3048631 RepID=UPI002B22C861|nr:hypothetical protein [Variovorax sp. RTB1]MEB0112782.1 hypothetical protein [Variovorax sp. RTB1]
MSMGVLKDLFDQLEQRHAPSSATPETAGVSPAVSAQPAPVLARTPETSETANSDYSGNQVVEPAANDPEPVLVGWSVSGLEGASPATVAKFRAATQALDRQIAVEGGSTDPDRSCCPHSSAMNTAEIDTFTARVDRSAQLGLPPDRAEAIADKLAIRDREGDDRRMCVECGNLSSGRRCAAWQRADIGGSSVGELLIFFQRCPAYRDRIQS